MTTGPAEEKAVPPDRLRASHAGVVIFTLFVTGYQVRESRHPGRSAEPLPPGTAS